jgi:flagellar biosynthesis anti-sigma factor FlgM
MDIRDIRSSAASGLDAARRVGRPAGDSAAQGSAAPEGDRVTVSDRARVLQDVRRAALAVPDVRQDRVEEFRRKLAASQLLPDQGAIARALVGQGLLG